MDRLCKGALWALTVMVFVSVLFADFFPLPLGAYASQRFLLAGLLALAVIISGALWMYRHGWIAVQRVWPAILVAASFLLLTLPFRNMPYAWVEPGMYAAFLFGFVLAGSVLAAWAKKYDGLVGVVYVGSIAAAFYGGATITVYLFALSDQVSNLSNFIPWGFVNIRYWSHIATWLIPLLPLAVLVGPLKTQRLWRFFVALGAALWWWIIFLSSSRGSMLGLAFGVLFVAVAIGRPAQPWLKIFLRYLAYGVLVWLLLSVFVPSLLLDEVTLRTLKTDSSGRMPLFIEAWQMSQVNFPFGLGSQSWLTHEILSEQYQRSSKFGHPHNMYLMWAAEYGWLLIAALLTLVGQAIRLFLLRRAEIRSGENTELGLPLAAFTASVAAASLHAGVSAVFMAPGSMLVGFLVLSVFWSLITPAALPTASGSPRKRQLASVLFAFLVCLPCAYWLKSIAEYHADMVQDEVFYYENVPAGTLPRFWFHGNYPRHSDQMP